MSVESLYQSIQFGNSLEVAKLLDSHPEWLTARLPESLMSETSRWDEISPLHAAAKYGHLDIVRMLVACGAEVYSNPFASYPAVIVADWAGHQAVVDYFLNEIPNQAEGTRGVGVTCNLAGRQGWLERVKRHIEIDPLAVHQRGWIGDTPLHWPAHNGYIEIVRLLLEHGADPTAHEISWIGGTPLHWASERHPNICRLLIDFGADPNARVLLEGSGHQGGTPLHWCARQPEDCAECIETLRAAGADVSIVDATGKRAIDWATELGHKRCAAALA